MADIVVQNVDTIIVNHMLSLYLIVIVVILDHVRLIVSLLHVVLVVRYKAEEDAEIITRVQLVVK